MKYFLLVLTVVVCSACARTPQACSADTDCSKGAYCNLDVKACFRISAPSIVTTDLADAFVQADYRAKVGAEGGTAPVRFALADVPAELSWLKIDETTGELTGVPIVPTDRRVFTARVTDDEGRVAEATLRLSARHCEGTECVIQVVFEGSGGGRVVSAPQGLDCSSSCSAPFARGTAMTLSAVPNDASDFVEFTGACSGSQPCSFTVDAPRRVTARFARAWVRYGTESPSQIAEAHDVAVDATGEIFVLGTTGPQLFLRKYSPDGEIRWTTTDSDIPRAECVIPHPSGKTFIAGTDFANDAPFLWELDGAGQNKRVMTWFAPTSGTVQDCTVLSTGDLVISGSGANGGRAWVSRHAPTGEWVSTELDSRLGAQTFSSAMAVTATSSGVFTTGGISIDGSPTSTVLIGFDGTSSQPSVTLDGAKGGGPDIGMAIGSLTGGDLVVAAIDNNTDPEADVVVTRLRPSLEEVWRLSWDGPDRGSDKVSDLAVAPNGDIFIAGSTSSATTTHRYFARVSSAGRFIWTRVLPSTHVDYAHAVATDPSGNIIVVGREAVSDSMSRIWVYKRYE